MKRTFQLFPFLLILLVSCGDEVLQIDTQDLAELELDSRNTDCLMITPIEDPEEECCVFSVCVPPAAYGNYYLLESDNPNTSITLTSGKPKGGGLQVIGFPNDVVPVQVNTCWRVVTCDDDVLSLFSVNPRSRIKQLVCQEEVECTTDCCEDVCYEIITYEVPEIGECFTFELVVNGVEDCTSINPFKGIALSDGFEIHNIDHQSAGAIITVCPNNSNGNPKLFEFATQMGTSECGPFIIGPVNPYYPSGNEPNLCQ